MVKHYKIQHASKMQSSDVLTPQQRFWGVQNVSEGKASQ